MRGGFGVIITGATLAQSHAYKHAQKGRLLLCELALFIGLNTLCQKKKPSLEPEHKKVSEREN